MPKERNTDEVIEDVDSQALGFINDRFKEKIDAAVQGRKDY